MSPQSRARVATDAATVVVLMTIQFLWLCGFIDHWVALINLLPTAMFFAMWTSFASHCYANDVRRRLLLLLPALVLTLRLPLTLSPVLEPLSWLLVCGMAGFVVLRLGKTFRQAGELRYLLLTAALVGVNTLTHTGLDSPFTYTFRLINGLPSAFAGADDDRTWECAYERPDYAVHCDARHFIASERIFTEPHFDASYSVVLPRFWSGYLNSLVGIEGHRWLASLLVNAVFWLLACLAVHRVATLLQQSRQTAAIAMLSCASAWGFVSMVAQPAPYALAFAYGVFVVWATVELVLGEHELWPLLPLVIVSVVMVYEAYPLLLASALFLLFYRRYKTAAVVLLGPLVLTLLWRFVFLRMVLGTEGALDDSASGVSNLALDFGTWWQALITFDVAQLGRLALFGIGAYLIGNLLIGSVAAGFYVAVRIKEQGRAAWQEPYVRLLVYLNGAVLLATLFVAPQMRHWSPNTGMQPRLAYFTYPTNLIALAALPFTKKHLWLVPVLLFLLANIDLTGLATLPLLFDYGALQLVWK
jgi:hypothetical protein